MCLGSSRHSSTDCGRNPRPGLSHHLLSQYSFWPTAPRSLPETDALMGIGKTKKNSKCLIPVRSAGEPLTPALKNLGNRKGPSSALGYAGPFNCGENYISEKLNFFSFFFLPFRDDPRLVKNNNFSSLFVFKCTGKCVCAWTKNLVCFVGGELSKVRSQRCVAPQ